MVNLFHDHLSIRIVVYAFLFCLLLFAFLKFQEQKGIYFPDKEIKFYPSGVNLGFKEIDLFTADKLKINAWHIPCDQAKFTLLFCHGNAGNLTSRLDKIKLLHNLGFSIFIFDYRGFGKSQGSPRENGLYLDARAAYEYLVNTLKVKTEEIVLYGESMGSAVAVDLARRIQVGGLIIEGGFSSGKDMAAKLYPFLPRFIFSDIFDSLSKIRVIRVPILFIHASEDELVPLRLAVKLYHAANAPKEFLELPGDHNGSFFDSWQKVAASISAFMRKL